MKATLDLLSGHGLHREAAATGARDALRSTVHHFVNRQTSSGFGLPVDPSHSFDRLADVLITAFEIRRHNPAYRKDGHVHHDHTRDRCSHPRWRGHRRTGRRRHGRSAHLAADSKV